MAFVETDDGARLYVEETGRGYPILFIHEFAGDHRSWGPQVRHFAPHFRCITYAARGYPPSDVPTDASSYSQQHAVADALAVLDDLSITRAHVVGLSMGGFCALHLALQRPDRVRTLVAASIGYGAEPSRENAFREECERTALALLNDGTAEVARWYSVGPTRIQLREKDPAAWAEFASQLSEHSAVGSALTMRGVQGSRQSLYQLAEDLRQLTVPVLLMVGDQDEPALDPTRMLERTIPSATLAVVPGTGHMINLEEPDLFNQRVFAFLTDAPP
jgi:pimeloyl-ACP methyl ester carboxylesterase